MDDLLYGDIETSLAFDGVPIGIGKGLAEHGRFPAGFPLSPATQNSSLHQARSKRCGSLAIATTPLPASAPLEGWKPIRLPYGSWGSLYAGPNPNTLPLGIVGLTNTVWTRSGKSWDATITDVVERSPAASWPALENSI